jgi:hypothetical protein
MRGDSDDLSDLFLGEDIRRWSRASLLTEDRGRYFMAWVFCPQILTKASDIGQPPSPLRDRRDLTRPLDRGCGVQVSLALGI